MKAVFIKEFGGREKLNYTEDFPKPVPQEGEVLVKIKAAGINPVDFKIREGLRRNLPYKLPSILGWDMAGIVEERGFAARRFQAGEAVYAYARRPEVEKGTYAEYISIPECYLSKKPANINFEEAAAIPLAGLTAYQSLHYKGQIKAGQKILILGASGGVGSMAVQLAKIAGAKVIAVAGISNHEYLKALGADICISYDQPNWGSQLLEQTGEKVDLVFDCIGGQSLSQSFELVKPGANLVSITTREMADLTAQWKINFLFHFVEPDSHDLDMLTRFIEDGKLKIHINTVFPLKDANKAHEKIETGHTRGKIVLSV